MLLTKTFLEVLKMLLLFSDWSFQVNINAEYVFAKYVQLINMYGIHNKSNNLFHNSFHTTSLFLYHMKIENFWFSDVIWGYREKKTDIRNLNRVLL